MGICGARKRDATLLYFYLLRDEQDTVRIEFDRCKPQGAFALFEYTKRRRLFVINAGKLLRRLVRTQEYKL